MILLLLLTVVSATPLQKTQFDTNSQDACERAGNKCIDASNEVCNTVTKVCDCKSKFVRVQNQCKTEESVECKDGGTKCQDPMKEICDNNSRTCKASEVATVTNVTKANTTETKSVIVVAKAETTATKGVTAKAETTVTEGATVVTKNGTTSPPCKSDCPSTPNSVCGSDGNAYFSECHMKYTACKEKRVIKVIAQGGCEQTLNMQTSLSLVGLAYDQAYEDFKNQKTANLIKTLTGKLKELYASWNIDGLDAVQILSISPTMVLQQRITIKHVTNDTSNLDSLLYWLAYDVENLIAYKANGAKIEVDGTPVSLKEIHLVGLNGWEIWNTASECTAFARCGQGVRVRTRKCLDDICSLGKDTATYYKNATDTSTRWCYKACNFTHSCSGNFHGRDCDKPCNCKYDVKCGDLTGYCPTGCANGFGGESTCSYKRPCSGSYYGEYCQHRCHCMYDLRCDRDTGACPEGVGCLEGFKGQNCSERDLGNTCSGEEVIEVSNEDCTCQKYINTPRTGLEIVSYGSCDVDELFSTETCKCVHRSEYPTCRGTTRNICGDYDEWTYFENAVYQCYSYNDTEFAKIRAEIMTLMEQDEGLDWLGKEDWKHTALNKYGDRVKQIVDSRDTCLADVDCPQGMICARRSYYCEHRCICPYGFVGVTEAFCRPGMRDFFTWMSNDLDWVKPMIGNNSLYGAVAVNYITQIMDDFTLLSRAATCHARSWMCRDTESFQLLFGTDWIPRPDGHVTTNFAEVQELVCSVLHSRISVIYRQAFGSWITVGMFMNTLPVDDLVALGKDMQKLYSMFHLMPLDGKGPLGSMGIDLKLMHELDRNYRLPLNYVMDRLSSVSLDYTSNSTTLSNWLALQSSNYKIRIYLSLIQECLSALNHFYEKLREHLKDSDILGSFRKTTELVKITKLLDAMPNIVGALAQVAFDPVKLEMLIRELIKVPHPCEWSALFRVLDVRGVDFSQLVKSICDIHLGRLVTEVGYDAMVSFLNKMILPTHLYNDVYDTGYFTKNVTKLTNNFNEIAKLMGLMIEKYARGELPLPAFADIKNWQSNVVKPAHDQVIRFSKLDMRQIHEKAKEYVNLLGIVKDEYLPAYVKPLMAIFNDFLSLLVAVLNSFKCSSDDCSVFTTPFTAFDNLPNAQILARAFKFFFEVFNSFETESLRVFTTSVARGKRLCELFPEMFSGVNVGTYNTTFRHLCDIDVFDLEEELLTSNHRVAKPLHRLLFGEGSEFSIFDFVNNLKGVIDAAYKFSVEYKKAKMANKLPYGMSEGAWSLVRANFRGSYYYFDYIPGILPILRWKVFDNFTRAVAQLVRREEGEFISMLENIDEMKKGFQKCSGSVRPSDCSLRFERNGSDVWFYGKHVWNESQLGEVMEMGEKSWGIDIRVEYPQMLISKGVQWKTKLYYVPYEKFFKSHTLDENGRVVYAFLSTDRNVYDVCLADTEREIMDGTFVVKFELDFDQEVTNPDMLQKSLTSQLESRLNLLDRVKDLEVKRSSENGGSSLKVRFRLLPNDPTALTSTSTLKAVTELMRSIKGGMALRDPDQRLLLVLPKTLLIIPQRAYRREDETFTIDNRKEVLTGDKDEDEYKAGERKTNGAAMGKGLNVPWLAFGFGILAMANTLHQHTD